MKLALVPTHGADALAVLLGRELLGVLAKRPMPAHALERLAQNLRASTRRSSIVSRRSPRSGYGKITRAATCASGRARGLARGDARHLILWGPRTRRAAPPGAEGGGPPRGAGAPLGAPLGGARGAQPPPEGGEGARSASEGARSAAPKRGGRKKGKRRKIKGGARKI